MKYTRVFLDAIGYELPPIVITTEELESLLKPVYEKLHIAEGQVEMITGILERRWWEPGYRLSDGAIAAARKALAKSSARLEDLEILIYAGVCREWIEPATACRVGMELGINPSAEIYDISNACLGVLNGMIDIANRIELGQIRAGMVVSCETAREIVDASIERMLRNPEDMELFKYSIATLTGGSGAVAVILTDDSFAAEHRFLGGITRTALEFHDICRWQPDEDPSTPWWQVMRTDSVAVLNNGVELGRRTWQAFLEELNWTAEQIDKVICHQVGSAHQKTILKMLDLPAEKDFVTYPYLGNIGTVSLPITAAIAADRDCLQKGDKVSFLGIGSGLVCLMAGVEW